MGADLPVAAVVVNYNSGEALAGCVRSLLDENVREVVVVDNASSDGSPATVSDLAPRTRVLETGRNLGYGRAANIGVAETTTPYVAICNPDLVVSPGSLSALVARFESDESLAVVGPLIRDLDGDVYPSGRGFPTLTDALGHAFLGFVWGGNPWTRRYRHLGTDQHRSRQADWVSGAFMLVRRLAFESVGGFDPAFFMYAEDVDLCWRLERAGWRCWYEPAGEITHEQGRSTARHPYRMLLSHHLSMWRFAARSAEGTERLLLPAVAAGVGLRLAVAWAEHLLRPARERVAPTAKLRHRARG